MGILRVMLKLVEPATTIPKQIDYQRLASATRTLFDFLKNLFTPTKATRKESFEEALVRLRVSEEALSSIARNFYWFAYGYLGFCILLVGYAGYLVHKHAYVSAGSAFIIACVVLAYAFRKRFWYFQIKTRRLGYTFKEWLYADLLGRNS